MGQKVAIKVADVLMHHLTSLGAGQMDELMLDYTDDSILMSPDQTFHGTAEIRAFYQAAIAGFPPELMKALMMIRQDIHDEVAYITWKAEPFIKMGTDTFVIRDEKIAVQTFLMVS
jgi:ketosteroid isomerase-like protein